MKQEVRNLTKFQWKVLEVTAKIPMGETRSYQWVAKQVGSPKAVRAVGQALKRNPYPVTIPCHRVIKQDGSLGGYSGGPVSKKARLLAIERDLKEYMEKRRTSNRRQQTDSSDLLLRKMNIMEAV
jgi:O-6-methylguanine DNA methyltransferase